MNVHSGPRRLVWLAPPILRGDTPSEQPTERSQLASPESLLLKCFAIPNVIDELEGRNDFLVVGHHDDGGSKLLGHVVENAHNTKCPLAIQWCRRFRSEERRVGK